jgi:predicted nucleic-acid-binding Zn-ribbon protein
MGCTAVKEAVMITCQKCQGATEQGFVADRVFSRWIEGALETNVLGLPKIRGKRKIPISTNRCTKCGYLELYARP